MKFLKKFAAILAAIMAVTCLAVFAVACNKDSDDKEEGYATTTFTVIVQYEDGTPIDGTKNRDGGSWLSDAVWPAMELPANCAQVQFCSVKSDGELGSCANPVNIDAEGKATLEVSAIKTVAETMQTTTVELHICNVKGFGYDKGEGNSAYGRFEIDKIPLTITVKLKKAA